MSIRSPHAFAALVGGCALCFLAFSTRAQELELEPNNACAEAQDLAGLALPLTIEGGLDPSLYPDDGDVDFYRFMAPPGAVLVADLKGSWSGDGTLPDPFLGLFGADCSLLAWNDDYYSVNSHLEFTVGVEGGFVLAATSCCSDGDFTGSQGSGTYRLTVAPAPERAVITGQAVDAETGLPLPGDSPPWTSAELLVCYSDDCSSYGWLVSQQADFEGVFLFDRDFLGEALSAGIYQVGLSANLYASWRSDPIALVEGDHVNFGPVSLTPLAMVESVSGRIVDAVSGLPLSGYDPIYASAELRRCTDPQCTGHDAYFYAQADGEGRFSWVSQPSGWPVLLVGTYQVFAQAQDYEQGSTAPFELAENQAFDVGDIPLAPPPVTFSEIQPCAGVPSTGGTCRYRVLVTNTGSEPVGGRVWSMVNAYGIGARLPDTHFQASANAYLRLAPAQRRWLQFSFDVPAKTGDGAFICTDATFGAGRGPEQYFEPLRRRELFCLVKGYNAYTLLTPEQAAPKLKALKERGSKR